MTVSSYTDLQSRLITLAEDTSTEFANYINTAVNLAESRLFRELDIDFSRDEIVTLSPGINTVTKPANVRAVHDFSITVSGALKRLTQKTDSYIRDYWPSSLTTGVPKYYAPLTDTLFLVAPTPDTTYSGTFHVDGQPTLLGPSNATNIILEKYPDLMLMASMLEMCHWMKDPDRIAEWGSKVATAIDTVNNEGRRNRQDDATNANNPAGGQNTLVKGRT